MSFCQITFLCCALIALCHVLPVHSVTKLSGFIRGTLHWSTTFMMMSAVRCLPDGCKVSLPSASSLQASSVGASCSELTVLVLCVRES